MDLDKSIFNFFVRLLYMLYETQKNNFITDKMKLFFLYLCLTRHNYIIGKSCLKFNLNEKSEQMFAKTIALFIFV